MIKLLLTAFLLSAALRSQTLTTLLNFDGTDSEWPNQIIEGPDANLYGSAGLAARTLFRVTRQGMLTTLYSFSSYGSPIVVGLTLGNDGNLYGIRESSHDFLFFRANLDGALDRINLIGSSSGQLTAGVDGRFYFTSDVGGNCFDFMTPIPCGTAFALTPAGSESTVAVLNQTGWTPSALMQARDGNLYGTTEAGGGIGLPGFYCNEGCGSAFKIARNGTLSYIHLFEYSDGAWPLSRPTEGNDGDFYGVTYAGGNSGCYFGCGVVYKMTSDGAVTVSSWVRADRGKHALQFADPGE